MSSGSAPISRDVADFLNIAFSCYVSEGMRLLLSMSSSLSLIFSGYGMTETCAVGNKTWKDDPDSCSTVGPPQSSNEMKLVDVPAMGYTSEDIPNPRGELYVRGANCFSRYYKGQHLMECFLVRQLTLSRREKHEGDHRRGRMGSHWGCSRDRLLWQVQDH